jgi:hypothetical protein
MPRPLFAVALTAVFCLVEVRGIAETPATLQPPSAFSSIAGLEMRSAALFQEAGKVLQSPRCLNCHPVTRTPSQADDMHVHVPPVLGAADNHGTKGLPCTSCHGTANAGTLGQTIKSIPGASGWALAPASMAWQGKSLADICAQLKDPSRNGGRSLAQIHEHLATDHLVGWAWHPGGGRTPAPGTQQQLGALIKAWIEFGAHCPLNRPTSATVTTADAARDP